MVGANGPRDGTPRLSVVTGDVTERAVACVVQHLISTSLILSALAPLPARDRNVFTSNDGSDDAAFTRDLIAASMLVPDCFFEPWEAMMFLE